MATTIPKSDRYLWIRPESRHIWFRLAVPKEHREFEGRSLIAQSLGTSDRKEAGIRAGKLRAELFDKWTGKGAARVALVRRVPTLIELEEAATLIAHDLEREVSDAGRKSLRGKGHWMWQGHINFTANQLAEQRRFTATGDHTAASRFADEAIDALGFDLPRGSTGYLTFCDLLNEAHLAALQVKQARNLGNMDAEPESKLVARVRRRERSHTGSGGMMLALFEIYATGHLAARTKRAAGVAQDRMVILQFVDFLGGDRDVAEIEYDDAKGFVDSLEHVPRSYKKRAAYRGLTFQEAVAKGKSDGAETLSVITQARYVSQLAPFFEWLTEEKGGRKIAVNPFRGLHKDVSRIKGTKRRPPFSAEQITTMINSPLFVGFAADGKEHLPGQRRADDWRYWIPLVCLFTGARIGEVAQLDIENVFDERKISCVELVHEVEHGRHIKNYHSRTIAIHPTLIAIGFLDFVRRQKARQQGNGGGALFPELVIGPREQFGDMPSRWFRDYLKAIGIKLGKDGFGAHSFRHTMADQLRAAGHLDAVIGALVLGHGSTGTTGRYGEGVQGTIEQSRTLIESVNFIPLLRGRAVAGGLPVDFSHLMQAGP